MRSILPLTLAILSSSLLSTGCQNIESENGLNTVQQQTKQDRQKNILLSPKTLAHYEWQLLSATDKSGQPISILENINHPVKLIFQLEQGRQNIAFTVGCNGMGANFSLANNSLKTGSIITTEMYCQDLDPAEKLLGQLMAGNSKLSIESKQGSMSAQPILTQQLATGEVLVWKATATPEVKYQQQADIVFWEVHHQLQDCPNPDLKNCLKVRPVYYNDQGIKQGVGDWDIFVDSIEGYQHDSSVDTVLRLKRFVVDPVDVKGKQFVYVLDTIIESSVAE